VQAQDVDDEGDDEYADSSQAHLVVHKHCLGAPPSSNIPYLVVVQGKNVTVEAILYNSGTRYVFVRMCVFMDLCTCEGVHIGKSNQYSSHHTLCIVRMQHCHGCSLQ
jgi:Na+-translocating ferredoxin:NAD+ oxidoreductase RnfE subunit